MIRVLLVSCLWLSMLASAWAQIAVPDVRDGAHPDTNRFGIKLTQVAE